MEVAVLDFGSISIVIELFNEPVTAYSPFAEGGDLKTRRITFSARLAIDYRHDLRRHQRE